MPAFDTVKSPNVAGKFYSAEPKQLFTHIKQLLSQAKQAKGVSPKALIVPHAGYIYSGEIAANAYIKLLAIRDTIRRVLLLGPPHFHPVRGIAAPKVDGFATPLGIVPLDRALLDSCLELPFVRSLPIAFEREHSLETQLPFLQCLLPKFSLLPLLIGDASPAAVGTLLERAWGGPETLIVVSSDLSHFLDYNSAQAIDSRTCAAIEALDSETIDYDQACGRRAVNGLLYTARRRRLTVHTLDLRNSGDTAGDRARVVGYGAWAFEEPTEPALSMINKRILLGVAANSIRHGLDNGTPLAINADDYSAPLNTLGRTFVTLEMNGALRGCIGSLKASQALIKDVANNAYAAAFKDTRFPAVSATELDDLELHVSVLHPPRRMHVETREQLLVRLRPGVDGLFIEDDRRRATFLPSVWEHIADRQQFVSSLLLKGGWKASYWSLDLRIYTYTTENFS